MDPAKNILTGKTMEQTIAEEKFKEELERRSEDEIRIFNPLQETYICYWNSYGHEFPFGKVTIAKRYIAEKCMGEIIDKILTDRAGKDIERINQKRYEQGQPKLTPQEISLIEGGPDYKITEPKLRKPLILQIWKGIFKENRLNIVLPSKRLAPQDTRPIDEQLIEQIDRESILEDESPVQTPLNKDFIEGVGVVKPELTPVQAVPKKTVEDIVPKKKG